MRIAKCAFCAGFRKYFFSGNAFLHEVILHHHRFFELILHGTASCDDGHGFFRVVNFQCLIQPVFHQYGWRPVCIGREAQDYQRFLIGLALLVRNSALAIQSGENQQSEKCRFQYEIFHPLNLTKVRQIFFRENFCHYFWLMKIATYNVNGVNGRLPVLLKWLAETQPDVACLQELKAPQEKFPLLAINEAGYDAIWHGQKSWNGVAVLAKQGIGMEERRRGLDGDDDDLQSRYLEVMVRETVIGCIYLPNGNPAPGPKFDYKMRWFERLAAHSEMLITSGKPAMLVGDFNVMPTEKDVYKPEKWVDDALFRPEVRAAFFDLVNQGWTDALRHLYPDETIYTFWDYFRQAFQRNAGLRIDHFLLSEDLVPKLREVQVDKFVRGWEKTSDHAPVWIELVD